jgi:RND family efflux transporter MFP subunit
MFYMVYRIILFTSLLFAFAGCNSSKNKSEADHEHAAGEAHEEPKFQYTAYSDNFEFFAEADAFVVGEKGNVLSHFSALPDFKAVEEGKITLVLSVNGKEVSQTLEQPTRKGIYSFDIQPETVGKGTLKFAISTRKGSFEIIVPEIIVFADHEKAHEAAENVVVSKTNTAVFTKEQSWKIDFTTAYPQTGAFGQVIKTTALVEPAIGEETVVTAKASGIVRVNSNILTEGQEVKSGQVIFSISGNEMADNNFGVKYTEAQNNYEKAKADYERAKELAKDKIVPEKELLAAKTSYENAKVYFENLSKNFNAEGQRVTSPMSGFVKQLLVKNGIYVQAGQPLLVISQNNTLVLTAQVPQKYAGALSMLQKANIRSLNENRSYSLEELNGKILSVGKAANSDNFLIPVSMQIKNIGNFIPGSFVEVYLKTLTTQQGINVPNTALLEEQGVFFVWVQINPELFEKREVAIGETDAVNTEIKGGISATDRIVTRGAIMIKLAQSTGALDAHSGHVH